MASSYIGHCGCEIEVVQWTKRRKLVSLKQCALHENAAELLKQAKISLSWCVTCGGASGIGNDCSFCGPLSNAIAKSEDRASEVRA